MLVKFQKLGLERASQNAFQPYESNLEDISVCKGHICVKHLLSFSEMVPEIKGVQMGSLCTRHKIVIGCLFELCDRHILQLSNTQYYGYVVMEMVTDLGINSTQEDLVNPNFKSKTPQPCHATPKTTPFSEFTPSLGLTVNVCLAKK